MGNGIFKYLEDKFNRLYEFTERVIGGGRNMEKLRYLFFGGLTTIVNYGVYFLFRALIDTGYSYLIANGAAWVAAVVFAFVTNKLFVFKSKTRSRAELAAEAGSFVAARLASLLFDYGWMILAVEVINLHDGVAKLLSNVIIVIINYYFSKMFIFKKKGESSADEPSADGLSADGPLTDGPLTDGGIQACDAPESVKLADDPLDGGIQINDPPDGGMQANDPPDGGMQVDAPPYGSPPVKAWFLNNAYLLLSFLMPVTLLLIAFAVIGIFPFGENSILIIDNHHQYTPFLIEFGKILREGGSLLHSWTAGLGSNYLSRFAYYLSSPLNFFSVFIKDSAATEFVLALVLFRAGAAGLALFVYLRAKTATQSFITVAFAVMYALCGFFLAYYWNIMWFDCVAVFPLIALGIEKLADGGNGLPYCLALAYAIISNYFIAIMICIFSALYFAAYFTGGVSRREKTDIRAARPPSCGAPLKLARFTGVPGRIGLFALYSLIAGALSAIVTLPAYYGLLQSSAAGAELPKSIRFYSDIIDILANHLALLKPSIMVGLPNIYCGVAVMILVPLYFINRAIPFKEKIANGLLFSFFIISFNVNTLDFLWHGTHFPNSLFFRFAFLYVFLILSMSYRAIIHIDAVCGREVFASFALLAGFILFMEIQPAEKTTSWTIYGSLAFAMAESIVVVILLRRRRGVVAGEPGLRGAYKAAEIALAVLICAEITVNAGYGIGESGIFPKQNYLSKTADIKPAVNLVKSLEPDGGYGFERMEFTEHTTYNTPIVYGYKGISYYSSTSYVAVNEMFGKLGLIDSNAWYVYRSAPPPFNSMFAIRYLLSQNGAYYNGIYPETDLTGEDMAGNVKVYENPYFLPVGFMVNDSLLSWGFTQANPFLCQEDFYRRAAGLSEPLFYRLEPEAVTVTNMSVSSGGGQNGLYHYWPENDNNVKAVYKVTALQDGPIYFYVKCPNIETVRITNKTFLNLRESARTDGGAADPDTGGARIAGAGASAQIGGADVLANNNGADTAAVKAEDGLEPFLPAGMIPNPVTEHTIRYPYVIDAQFVRAGEDAEIELIFENADADSFTLYAYGFNESAFAGVWNRLSGQGLRVTGYTDTRLDGVVDVKDPGLLYTSIPYSTGWSVYVDGAPAAAETTGGGALIAVRLPAGRHEISFKYMTPGLIPGAVITLCAALLLVCVQLTLRKPEKTERGNHRSLQPEHPLL